jgi:hypothetical protein
MLDDDTRDRRYHPRSFEELAEDPIPVSWINEPLPPDNVSAMPVRRKHSLHAVLCDALTSNRGLLQRLELGVTASPGEAREAIRELYVQVRRTVQVLSRCLELQGLE